MKRKITKLRLEELAKVMPVLDECEMREMIGRDKLYMDLSGQITFVEIEANSTVDTLIIEGGMKKEIQKGAFTYNTNGDNIETKQMNSNVALDVFKFLADNTGVEWACVVDKQGKGHITTSHMNNSVGSNITSNTVAHYHSHTDGSKASIVDRMNATTGGGISWYLYSNGNMSSINSIGGSGSNSGSDGPSGSITGVITGNIY